MHCRRLVHTIADLKLPYKMLTSEELGTDVILINQIGGAVWRRLQGVTGQPRASR